MSVRGLQPTVFPRKCRGLPWATQSSSRDDDGATRPRVRARAAAHPRARLRSADAADARAARPAGSAAAPGSARPQRTTRAARAAAPTPAVSRDGVLAGEDARRAAPVARVTAPPSSATPSLGGARLAGNLDYEDVPADPKNEAVPERSDTDRDRVVVVPTPAPAQVVVSSGATAQPARQTRTSWDDDDDEEEEEEDGDDDDEDGDDGCRMTKARRKAKKGERRGIRARDRDRARAPATSGRRGTHRRRAPRRLPAETARARESPRRRRGRRGRRGPPSRMRRGPPAEAPEAREGPTPTAAAATTTPRRRRPPPRRRRPLRYPFGYPFESTRVLGAERQPATPPRLPAPAARLQTARRVREAAAACEAMLAYMKAGRRRRRRRQRRRRRRRRATRGNEARPEAVEARPEDPGTQPSTGHGRRRQAHAAGATRPACPAWASRRCPARLARPRRRGAAGGDTAGAATGSELVVLESDGRSPPSGSRSSAAAGGRRRRFRLRRAHRRGVGGSEGHVGAALVARARMVQRQAPERFSRQGQQRGRRREGCQVSGAADDRGSGDGGGRGVVVVVVEQRGTARGSEEGRPADDHRGGELLRLVTARVMTSALKISAAS